MESKIGIGFSREAVEAAGQDWAKVEVSNRILERLKKHRLPAIQRKGADRFPAVFNIKCFQQGVLYRTVMLADGCADAWNADNPLAAALCARAIIETTAYFDNFETELSKLCEEGDLSAIEELIAETALATRLEDLTGGSKAVNAISLIEKLDRQLGKKKEEGILGLYEFLCEFCHPNCYGHTHFYQVDKDTWTVNLSDKPIPGKSLFNYIFGGFFLIEAIELSFRNIEISLLPKVLKLSEAAGG